MRSFELKLAPPVLTIVIALLMGGWLWADGLHPNLLPVRVLTVIVFLGLGLTIVACAIQNLRHAGTTLDPTNPSLATHLVTEGVYSWSRNPMYLGLLVMLVATARAFDSYVLYAGPLLFYLLVERLQIKPEERALSEKFGEEYKTYTARVRRWL